MVGTGVVPIPPRFGGGTEIFLYEISRFVSRKFSTLLVDRRWPGTLPEEEREGIKFIRVRVPKFDNVFLLRLTEFLLGLRALVEAYRRRVDLVHLHTPFTALPFALFRFLLPSKTRLLYTCHNPAWTVFDDELDPFNLLIERLEGYVMKKVDIVTTDSKTSRAWILRKIFLPATRVISIYNFVDLERFSKAPRGAWKKGRGIKGPVILYASKLTRAKGIDVFIKAVRLVKEEFPYAKFVVVGPVSFERKAKNPWIRLAEEEGVMGDIIFTGAVSEEEYPLIFASADVFCLPTQRETFCIAIAEAMAAGLPVVTSDLEALREVADGGAVFVRKGEVKEVAEALKKLLRLKILKNKLGKLAQKKARKYDKRKVLPVYLALYSHLVKTVSKRG